VGGWTNNRIDNIKQLKNFRFRFVVDQGGHGYFTTEHDDVAHGCNVKDSIKGEERGERVDAKRGKEWGGWRERGRRGRREEGG
jgi:hypothetical protein